MSNRNLWSGSDGSLDQESKLASFGWLILGNGNILVQGVGPVDGISDLLSLTQAELFGIAAKIEFLYQFCRYSNISVTKSQLVAFVDNRAAIKRVNHTHGKHSMRQRICHNVDIITHISDRLDEMSLRIRLKWVKSHQDKKKLYSELDIAGRLNVDADSLAEKFRLRMEEGLDAPIKEGALIPSVAVSLSVDGVRIHSHYSHKIRVHIQGKKHQKLLQEKHEWSDAVWKSLDLNSLKIAFLTLDPVKRISCSKRIHGWINMGEQKSKISPDAPEAHRCPHCALPLEDQEHILTCKHVSANRRRYELVLPMKRKMLTISNCRVQQLFVKCIKQWLAHPETPITPDISHIPDKQRALVETALEEQELIGWNLGMRGYLSRHWAMAVSANPKITKSDKETVELGRDWSRKVILQLWEFGGQMWKHRNSILHDPKIDDSRQMKSVAVNAAIIKLYAEVDTYAAEDCWYFEMPLAFRLCKLL